MHLHLNGANNLFSGNIKYERSHDNKLIIWSPGHGRDATPNNQAANTTAPRLPYQRLLTRASSSSPDCRTGVIPASSPAMEDVFPYQKLVKSVPSLRCSDKEESAADASTEKECDVAQQKVYQSLSLQRNPLVRGSTEIQVMNVFLTYTPRGVVFLNKAKPVTWKEVNRHSLIENVLVPAVFIPVALKINPCILLPLNPTRSRRLSLACNYKSHLVGTSRAQRKNNM